MPVSIEIVPLSPSLDMYGEPESSTAYSLSGHVSVALSSSPSLFDKPRPVKLLLQSLTLIFEGQSELIALETGYSPLRIFHMSRELVPGEAMELSNEGYEDIDKPCQWDFVFDLTLPGWLPATSLFGDGSQGEAGTRYALFAKAHFINVDSGSSRAWSFTSFCSPFIRKIKVAHAERCDVTINRHVLPPVSAPSTLGLFPMIPYDVDAMIARDADSRDTTCIPSEVLSKLEVVASVPHNIGLDEGNVPLTLRLRTDKLSKEQQQRFKLTELDMDMKQVEKYRTSPSAAYTSQFPLPPRSSQPSSQPLLSPHPVKSFCDIGIIESPKSAKAFTSSFSILPADQSGKYTLSGDGLVLCHDSVAAEERERTWFKLRIDVPFSRTRPGDDTHWEEKYGRIKCLRPSGEGPQLHVHHELHIVLVCSYDRTHEGLQPACEHLQFTLPLYIVSVPSTPITPTSRLIHSPASSASSLPSALREEPSSDGPSLAVPTPYSCSLPAYSQLFHTNGDRKIDYSVPLPMYAPATPTLETFCSDAASSIASERTTRSDESNDVGAGKFIDSSPNLEASVTVE